MNKKAIRATNICIEVIRHRHGIPKKSLNLYILDASNCILFTHFFSDVIKVKFLLREISLKIC